jgi:hypothetical protein
MRRIWKNRELTDQMGENGLRFAEAFCAESRAYEEMREYLTGRGLRRKSPYLEIQWAQQPDFLLATHGAVFLC